MQDGLNLLNKDVRSSPERNPEPVRKELIIRSINAVK